MTRPVTPTAVALDDRDAALAGDAPAPLTLSSDGSNG